MFVLRRFLVSGGTYDLHRATDDAVIQEVARLVLTGRLRICNHPTGQAADTQRPSSDGGKSKDKDSDGDGRDGSRNGTATAGSSSAAQTGKTVDLSKTVKTTWLAIELVDMEGKPVPGQRYEVRRSGKVLKTGKLNGSGYARLDNLDPGGTYDVSFLDLDQEAWQPAPDKEHGS